MGKRIGGTSISIAQLRDGYSYTEVRLYSAEKREAYPLTLLYNFTTGALLSGVDGKTLTECLNGWSQEPGTGRYCTIASARTTGTIAEILTNAWCEQFLTAEDGETVTTVTLYTRSKNTPALPTSALVYNFSTGEITGDGKGDWRTSMEEFEGATAYALWSTSAIATRKGTVQTDTINASEWSTPKKIAENGTSPVEMYLDLYSWIFPADGDGFVAMSEYLKFSTDVLLVQGGEAIPFTLSVGTTGITGIETDGVTVKTTEDTVMLGDSASIRITAKYDGGTVSRTVSLAKARAGQPAILYFAWSSSETEFLPQPIPRFYSNGRLYSNTKLIAGVPAGVRWIFSKEDVSKFKTDVYKYLWCKTTWNGTPFLFTGYTGKDGLNGACTLYQYGLGDDQGNEPTTWYDTMEELFEAEGSLFNSGKFLWMRSQFVPAGGSPSPAGWGAPVIAGSDSSEVYARIEENKTSIATIVKTGGTIDQRITEYDNTTGVSTRSQIEQTANKIALRVDGTNIKTPGGIIVGIVEDESVIKLEADKIIASGTLSADKFTSDMAIISDLQISDGGSSVGKIRSAGYAKNTYSKDNAETGFYMDNEGHLEATNAFFKNATAIDLNIDGGEINSAAFQTIKGTTGGASYSSVKSGEYYKKEDVLALMNDVAVDYHVTAEEVNAGTAFSLDGTTYKLARNIKSVRDANYYYSQTASLGEETTFSFTVPSGYTKVYIRVPEQLKTITTKYSGSWGGVNPPEDSSITTEYWDYYYSLNGGSDTASNKEILELTVNAGETNSITITPVYKNGYTETYSGSSYTVITKIGMTTTTFGVYLPSTFPNGEYVTEAGIYLFKSANSWVMFSSLPDCVQTDISGISSKTPYYRYASFKTSSGEALTDRAADMTTCTIGGTTYTNGSLSYFNNTLILRNSSGTIIFSQNITQYFMTEEGYVAISFTCTKGSKGAYVTDLYPKEGGTKNIGSSGQLFNNVYANNFYGNLTGSFSGTFTGTTDTLDVNYVKVGSSNRVLIGQSGNNGYVNIGNDSESWDINIDSDGNLNFSCNTAVNNSVYMDANGLHGVCLSETTLLETTAFSAGEQRTLVLSDNPYNYELILLLLKAGGRSVGLLPALIAPYYLFNWYNTADTRLVFSTDALYFSFYFKYNLGSKTGRVTSYDSSAAHDLQIIGLK